jgi:hypothetical protein
MLHALCLFLLEWFVIERRGERIGRGTLAATGPWLIRHCRRQRCLHLDRNSVVDTDPFNFRLDVCPLFHLFHQIFYLNIILQIFKQKQAITNIYLFNPSIRFRRKTLWALGCKDTILFFKSDYLPHFSPGLCPFVTLAHATFR